MQKANLGDLARDRITGFEGIVFSRTAYLTGCDRVGLQPMSLDNDGMPKKPDTFDIMEVEVVEKRKISFKPAKAQPTEPQSAKKPGGPRPTNQKRK